MKKKAAISFPTSTTTTIHFLLASLEAANPYLKNL